MATEFNTGGPVRRDGPSLNRMREAHRMGRHWSTYVILALLAVVIVAGVVLTLQDKRAQNTTGTTVGSTTQTPPPAPVNRP